MQTQKPDRHVFWQSMWFWWVGLTGLYTILFFALSNPETKLFYTVGLFVPVGPLAGLGLLALKGLWALLLTSVLLLFVVYKVNAFAARAIENPGLKIATYLAVLSSATFLLDIWVYGCWLSFDLFLHPDFAGSCFSL